MITSETTHKAPVGFHWTTKEIQFRYSISYVCLFRVAFSGKAHRCPFNTSASNGFDLNALSAHLEPNADFLAVYDLRVEQAWPRVRLIPGGILYCLNQTQNYFIEFRGSFDDYLQLLSSKTRSTLKRKIKKFTELSGGCVDFRVYESPDQMREYHRIARDLASRTYQEKLFQGALPEGEEFCRDMQRLASENRVRGFLLFFNERPVAYLYTPISDGVAEYAYLGYEPDCAEHSPGTVLLYMAIQELFRNRNVRYFNFGYGANQTKSVFSTDQFLRADLFLFNKSLKNRVALYGHMWTDHFSEFCGHTLDKFGVRRAIKQWLRSR